MKVFEMSSHVIIVALCLLTFGKVDSAALYEGDYDIDTGDIQNNQRHSNPVAYFDSMTDFATFEIETEKGLTDEDMFREILNADPYEDEGDDNGDKDEDVHDEDFGVHWEY